MNVEEKFHKADKEEFRKGKEGDKKELKGWCEKEHTLQTKDTDVRLLQLISNNGNM